MTRTEDRLRTALREIAEQVPPGAVPPLELPAEVPGQPHRWPSAVAAAAAVCLIIGLSVTLAATPRQEPQPRQLAQLAEFPPYYVALQQGPGCGSCGPGNGQYATNPDRAVVGSTLTGSTLATVAVPKPFGTFAFVQGTADEREFILGAQRLAEFAGGTYPATKLYLLRLYPAGRPGHRARLTALPVPLLPGARGYELAWFALSPNGQSLAAISTTTATNNPTQLRVYDLATGASRTWLLPRWAERFDLVQDVAGPPSWSTDSQTLAFFDRTTAGGAELVLLDTRTPATSFGADSTTRPLPKPTGTDELIFGPDYPLLTPDGQHVLEEVVNRRDLSPRSGPLQAFALELVNLHTGSVSQLRQRSQMFFVLASDPSGSAVIVALRNLPPMSAVLVAWAGPGATPIPLPADTIAVAW